MEKGSQRGMRGVGREGMYSKNSFMDGACYTYDTLFFFLVARGHNFYINSAENTALFWFFVYFALFVCVFVFSCFFFFGLFLLFLLFNRSGWRLKVATTETGKKWI